MLFRSGSLYSTVIVPGKIVEDREAFYYAQRHHVFVKQDNVHTYLGEIPGKPIKFVDIDGKDLPGLVVEEGCDGWCISLWSLTGELRNIWRSLSQETIGVRKQSGSDSN